MNKYKIGCEFFFNSQDASEGSFGAPIFFFLFCRHRRRRKLTPRLGRPRRPKYGALMAPQIFFLFSFHSFTAAKGGGFPNGRHRHLNGDAQRAQRWRWRRHFPGGQGKPCRKREFASMFLNF